MDGYQIIQLCVFNSLEKPTEAEPLTPEAPPTVNPIVQCVIVSLDVATAFQFQALRKLPSFQFSEHLGMMLNFVMWHTKPAGIRL